jgi:hypothetical protein
MFTTRYPVLNFVQSELELLKLNLSLSVFVCGVTDSNNSHRLEHFQSYCMQISGVTDNSNFFLKKQNSELSSVKGCTFGTVMLLKKCKLLLLEFNNLSECIMCYSHEMWLVVLLEQFQVSKNCHPPFLELNTYDFESV